MSMDFSRHGNALLSADALDRIGRYHEVADPIFGNDIVASVWLSRFHNEIALAREPAAMLVERSEEGLAAVLAELERVRGVVSLVEHQDNYWTAKKSRTKRKSARR